MKRLLALLLVAAAPPANVTMQNGQPRAVTPVATIDANGNQVSPPAPGTAGSPSGDVMSVQGAPNGTPQNVTSRGAASISTGQVSVGTSPTLIVAARTLRERATVAVTSAVQCSFGGAGVTLTTGFPLQAVAGASLTLDTTAAIYGVCASTATVGYLEQY